jgi:hypothetical protein
VAAEELLVVKGELEHNDASWRAKLQEAETRAYEAIDMVDEADKMVEGRNKMVESKDEQLWQLKETLADKERECEGTGASARAERAERARGIVPGFASARRRPWVADPSRSRSPRRPGFASARILPGLVRGVVPGFASARIRPGLVRGVVPGLARAVARSRRRSWPRRANPSFALASLPSLVSAAQPS